MLDLLLINAEVVDGSGEAAKNIQVGVKDGFILLEPQEQEAKKIIDCKGLTLCPGFVESHSHGDMSIGTHHATLSKISQGVTTEIVGQCGQSPFPVDPRFLEELQVVMAFAPDFFNMPFEQFTSFFSFFSYIQEQPLRLNQAYLVGHNTLRTSVMGVENRPATRAELELMKERLKEAMDAGAVGLSSGLIYIPGVYAMHEEIVELCKVIEPYGGVYATHMRNEADHVVEAVQEAISVAEQSGVSLVISHHKICGKSNWGLAKKTLSLVEEANAKGLRVLVDQYPYEANMTALNVCIPPWHFAEGLPKLLEKLSDPLWRKQIEEEMRSRESRYDNFYKNSGGFQGVYVVSSPAVPEAEGKSIADYAMAAGKGEFEAYFDILLANRGGGSAIYFAMDPEEVEEIYLHRSTVVGSDGLPLAMDEKGHPRAWGSFIRPLRLFVREKQLLTFEEAIRKQTSQTADFWGLRNIGRIKEGYQADLVLLDREKLFDRATYQQPNLKADGVHSVYVRGELVYHKQELTGATPGRPLSI